MSKYNRTYHLPWSPGATSDDKIAQSVDRLLGVHIVITEKLDGENCGMTNQGVYARSHTQFTISPWSKEVRNIHEHKVLGQIPEGVFIFGENMEGIHSIEYTNLTSYFYVFGIRVADQWLSWQEVEEWSFLLDLPTVPVLFRGVCNSESELKELIERFSVEQSHLGGAREGLVVRTAGQFDNLEFTQNLAKWVRQDHVQSNEHWTKNWRKALISYT